MIENDDTILPFPQILPNLVLQSENSPIYVDISRQASYSITQRLNDITELQPDIRLHSFLIYL